MRLDDLAPVGPFSMYPRSSVVECGQILRTTPGPYRLRDYEARGRVVLQNKTPMSQYRAVGHPVAALVMEAMVDRVARELSLDPVDVRRRNLLTADMYPYTAPTGLFFEKLSHEESLDAVLELSGYLALCAERDRLRARGVYRGLGLCVFIDLTVPGAATYGTGAADAGVASALVNTNQQIGGSIGTALLNTIAASALASYVLAHGRGPLVLAQAAVHSYVVGFWVSAAILAGSAVVCAPVLPSGTLAPAADPAHPSLGPPATMTAEEMSAHDR